LHLRAERIVQRLEGRRHRSASLETNVDATRFAATDRATLDPNTSGGSSPSCLRIFSGSIAEQIRFVGGRPDRPGAQGVTKAAADCFTTRRRQKDTTRRSAGAE
jgi:hypothetical protein